MDEDRWAELQAERDGDMFTVTCSGNDISKLMLLTVVVDFVARNAGISGEKFAQLLPGLLGVSQKYLEGSIEINLRDWQGQAGETGGQLWRH